jgi:hypothetical protein
MELCYTLVDEDSEEYDLYTINDYCIKGEDASNIMQNLKEEQMIFLYLAVSLCDEDYSDDITCA